ncbi:MAG: DUF996 domain-containing protein [Thermoprotei archaeon]|nr:DUF996 domain-containing protein [Thermoprotei archaeon]
MSLPILSLIGWVLLIISLHRLSHVYNEARLFRYASYSLASIVGGFILAILLVLFIGRTFLKTFSTYIGITAFLVFVGGIILMNYFIYKSLNLIVEKSGEELFKIAGQLMLIGAVTLVIFMGMVLSILGGTILALAFYGLKPPQQQKPAGETFVKSTNEGLQQHRL